MMRKEDRKERAVRILKDLDTLRSEWTPETATDLAEQERSRRERFKLLEAEVAVLRLLQAESRLLQQLLLGVGSFITGATFTMLAKWLLDV